MALVLKDRVKETTTTTGTGTLTLAGASSGFRSFAAIGDGNTTYYAISDAATGDWEVGVGAYTAAGTTLSRSTILASSTGSILSLGSGSKDVFCDLPAAKVLALDANNNIALAVNVDVDIYGFLNQTETTITFDNATNTFTLAPVGASWSYYRAGLKYTISGNKTVSLPVATGTTTMYFVYIDAIDGSLTQSTTPWTLYDTKVLVATVTRNSGLTPSYLLSEERHTCMWSRRDHMYEHYTQGTMYSSGGVLTGPTVGSSTNSAKTCAVTAANIFDEDIYEATSAITAGNGSTDTFYSLMYRTGASAWSWARSVMPFKYTGAGAIEYDNNGTMTAAGAGGGGSTRYVNYYLACTNVAGQESYAWIPGRAAFTTAALAYAEAFASFTMTGFPCAELVAIWQFTWDTNGTGLGLCRLVRTPVRVNSNIINSTTVVSGTHNGLSGIQGGAVDDYQHLTTAQLAVVAATSGTNTGDNATNTTYDSDYRAANFVAGTNYIAPGGALGTPSSGALSSCTVDGTNAVGFRNVPQNSQSTAYTTVLGDSGFHILHPSADTTARTFTIPANSSVAYPVGTAITFVNQNGAGVMTIAITTDTMRLAGAGTTGSRTLAANGTATALKITTTEWIISGTGLT